ncbi:MAG TPA: ABC transporter ATP-binding protein [Anaerolineaceae bacterium]|nr:ABC transporter ATP-binding protein [Anaerolineaceae bacterium]
MSDILVECWQLGKDYGDSMRTVRAVKDVSLQLKKGSFTAIMGPSGSGKTTLLNLIGTLDVPTRGKLFFEGVAVDSLNDDQLADFRRENIGFVFQLFNLIPSLNVMENVMIPLLPFRKALSFDLEDRARELVEMIGLGERFDHLPGELSGGEQQRVAIARAMINYPKLILADEPTGNLDTMTGQEVMNVLKRMKKNQGVTILLVTHDANVASHADEIFNIKDGMIVL